MKLNYYQVVFEEDREKEEISTEKMIILKIWTPY